MFVCLFIFCFVFLRNFLFFFSFFETLNRTRSLPLGESREIPLFCYWNWNPCFSARFSRRQIPAFIPCFVSKTEEDQILLFFQYFQSHQALEDCSKCSKKNWYPRHPHVQVVFVQIHLMFIFVLFFTLWVSLDGEIEIWPQLHQNAANSYKIKKNTLLNLVCSSCLKD